VRKGLIIIALNRNKSLASCPFNPLERTFSIVEFSSRGLKKKGRFSNVLQAHYSEKQSFSDEQTGKRMREKPHS
jgi:hypothetical protein